MKRYVFLWDNDIGWCEKLQRELAKFATEVIEIDALRQELRKPSTPEKKLKEELLQTLSEKEGVVIFSVTQLLEWEEEADVAIDCGSFQKDKSIFVWNEILREICERSMMPVILITDEESDEQELLAFEAGVCDYIRRDKDIRVSVRRILASFQKGKSDNAFATGKKELFYLDVIKQCICFAEKEITLTQKEYEVFRILWQKSGEMVSKEEILRGAWGEKLPGCNRVVDTIIKQLRNKLKETPYNIQTKYRQGYYMQAKK